MKTYYDWSEIIEDQRILQSAGSEHSRLQVEENKVA